MNWLISIVVVLGVYQLLEKKYKNENLQKLSIEIEQIVTISGDEQRL